MKLSMIHDKLYTVYTYTICVYYITYESYYEQLFKCITNICQKHTLIHTHWISKKNQQHYIQIQTYISI